MIVKIEATDYHGIGKYIVFINTDHIEYFTDKGNGIVRMKVGDREFFIKATFEQIIYGLRHLPYEGECLIREGLPL